MLKKFLLIFILTFLIISMSVNVNAKDLVTNLNIVQKASETKYLENDQGHISKEIVNSNKDIGEVTVEVKLSNVKKEQENTQIYDSTEIYLIVPESIVAKQEKFTKLLNNIETLSSKILSRNSNTKIGIIGIKGTISDVTTKEDGNAIIGDRDEGDVEGRESDTEIVSTPTNDINQLKNDLNSMNNEKIKYKSNLQAAIKKANESFSNNVNKILISLYDDVPDIAVGVKASVSYGGWNSEYKTVEEAVKAKHEKIATYTRDEILKLKSSNVSFILLRPDDTSYDETWYNSETGERVLDFDGSPYVQKLYGTEENPTYGKMYNFDENNIDNVITENIYKDVTEIIQSDISNIKIIDYFPQEIIDNFDFSYEDNPSIGNVSKNIDEESRTITWDIDALKGEETATLRYKLKIKDMKNEKLLNKTIETNEKVVLTYKDIDSKDYTVELTSSPKIQLSEVTEQDMNTNLDNTNNNQKNGIDTTVAKKKIPQTGMNMVIIMPSITAILLIIIVLYKKYKSYKDIK